MTSVGTSFTQHLIVKTPAAGRLPGVRSLTLGTRVSGGRLVAAPAGGFEVLDRGGRPVWSSPAPLMWDSNADTSGSAAITEGRPPGVATPALAGSRLGQDAAREGDKVKVMGQRIDAASMVLTPDATLLDAPSTRYPVTIDPTTGPAIYNWAMVDKTYPTTSYYNFTDADQGVGYQNFSGVSTKRLFFAFNTSGYLGKTVTAATFSAFETYSATCAAGTVDAYLTSNFSSGVTWNTQPPRVGGIQSSFSTKAGRSDCNPGGYLAKFNVLAGVKTRVAAGVAVTTIGLAGRSESTYSSWMRFAGPKNATTARRPKLSVTYNSTPSTPSTTKMFAPDTSTTCGTTLATTKKFNQTSSTAYMIATGADPDGGSLTMTFRLYTAATGVAAAADRVIGPIATTSAGAQFKFKIPATWNDGSYYWISKVSDGVLSSAWSGKCYITLDKTAPLKPTITSTTFIQDRLAPSDVTVGGFTLASVGATSLDYYWNGVKKANLLVNGTSGGAPAWTGNMTIPVTAVGWLQIIAVDGAGNHSPMSEAFYVKKAVGGKLAQFLFNDPTTAAPSPSTVFDSARDGGTEDLIAVADRPRYTFDMGTDAAWDVGKFAVQTGDQNRSLLLGGTGEEAVTVERPAVSERSFTIGAWVRLTDDSASRTVIAQDLEAAPANPDAAVATYDIGYDQVSDKFVFHVTTSSGATVTASDALPASVTNPSTGEVIDLPHTGAWVYLAAIYDKGSGTIRLHALHEYNRNPLDNPDTAGLTLSPGAVVPLGAGVGVKAGLGGFRVGDGAVGKSSWAGMVDNVSVWQQVLTDVGPDNAVTVNAQKQI
jgi:hypothetical protein